MFFFPPKNWKKSIISNFSLVETPRVRTKNVIFENTNRGEESGEEKKTKNFSKPDSSFFC